MAPEQHLRRPYRGEKSDIFALGVILFEMMSSHPPFNAATPKDQFYIALASKRFDAFWRKHSENKSPSFYSESFRDLFQRMMELDPNKRISMYQILEHPWTKETIAPS